jgi:hypothetical protein
MLKLNGFYVLHYPIPLNRMRNKIKLVEPEQGLEANDSVYKHVSSYWGKRENIQQFVKQKPKISKTIVK